MIRGCSLALILLSAAPLAAADGLPRAKPADVGVSAEKLRAGLRLFEDAVKRDDIKGAVLLVARDGKIVFHEAVGWRNQQEKLPMRKDTLFRMASNTKAVVATAVLMLADAGKLSVDDPIGKHLPAFNNRKCRAIRIRHLLSHTSGFRIKTLFLEPLMKPSKQHPHAPTLQLEVNRFAAVGPEKKPGTTYSYNNPGYNTLGALVEVVSGQPLETFLTQRIYTPLGMRETTNHPVPARFARMSVVYERVKKTGTWTIRHRQNSAMRVPFVRASGGMVSTAADFARFCQMFLNRGTLDGNRILSRAAVARMTRPQTQQVYPPEQRAKRKTFYGFGWNVSRDGVIAHGGSEGTFAWVDPKRKLIGLIFTQSPGGNVPRAEFMKLVTAACRTTPRN